MTSNVTNAAFAMSICPAAKFLNDASNTIHFVISSNKIYAETTLLYIHLPSISLVSYCFTLMQHYNICDCIELQ